MMRRKVSRRIHTERDETEQRDYIPGGAEGYEKKKKSSRMGHKSEEEPEKMQLKSLRVRMICILKFMSEK